MNVFVEDPGGRIPLYAGSDQMLRHLGYLLSKHLGWPPTLPATPSLASYAQHGFCFWSSDVTKFVSAQFGKYSEKVYGGIGNTGALDRSYFVLRYITANSSFIERRVKDQVLEQLVVEALFFHVAIWKQEVQPQFAGCA